MRQILPYFPNEMPGDGGPQLERWKLQSAGQLEIHRAQFGHSENINLLSSRKMGKRIMTVCFLTTNGDNFDNSITREKC